MRAIVNQNLCLRVLLLIPKTQGNKQPLDKDVTFTTPDEGITKTTLRTEKSLGDQHSRGNIPPPDMEPIHTPVIDPSRNGAKYQ
nr:hypothetical protein [Tanacetum cinerariifolium]